MNANPTYIVSTTTYFKNGNKRVKSNTFSDTMESLLKNLENAKNNFAGYAIKDFSYANGTVFGFFARQGNKEHCRMIVL